MRRSSSCSTDSSPRQLLCLESCTETCLPFKKNTSILVNFLMRFFELGLLLTHRPLSLFTYLFLNWLLFSFPRFRPISVFREANEDESGFTCCAFSARERFLMLGTCTGHLKLYNVFSGQEEASYSCHNSAITHLEPSRVGKVA